MILGKSYKVDELYQAYGPGTPFSSGAALGTAFDDAYNDNLGQSLGRGVLQRAVRNPERFTPEKIQAFQNMGLIDDEAASYLRDSLNSPMLTADQANEEFGLGGQLKFDQPIRRTEAQLLYDNKTKSLIRQERLSRSEGGVFNTVGRFIAGVAASTLDLGELAINFIPAAGVARKLGYLKNSGIFTRGAIDATAGTLLTRPFVAIQSANEQGDYDFLNVAQDLAFGVAIGGGLPAGFDKVGSFIDKRRAGRTIGVIDENAKNLTEPAITNSNLNTQIQKPIEYDVFNENSVDNAVAKVQEELPHTIVKKADPEITRGAIGQMVENQTVDVGEIAILKDRTILRDIENKVGDFDLYRELSKAELSFGQGRIDDFEKSSSVRAGLSNKSFRQFDGTIDGRKANIEFHGDVLPETTDAKAAFDYASNIVKDFEPSTFVSHEDGPNTLINAKYVTQKNDGKKVVTHIYDDYRTLDNVYQPHRTISIRPLNNLEKDIQLSKPRNYEIPSTKITDKEIQDGFNNYVSKAKQDSEPANIQQEIAKTRKTEPANNNPVKQDIADLEETLTELEQQYGNLTPEETKFVNEVGDIDKQAEEIGKTSQAAANCILGVL